jgi:hypothetical protein
VILATSMVWSLLRPRKMPGTHRDKPLQLN